MDSIEDPETSFEIATLLEHRDDARLEELLGSRLTFGTAGLRARMGAGYTCLNSLTIVQTSQGLAQYLLKHEQATAGVVIGYDARHKSKRFADLTAATFDAKGIPVYLFEDLVHTPLVPFAVKQLGAAAGIMITASHNPSYDNGYKVYASNACQIIPPADEEIAASILENLEPTTWDVTLRVPRRKPILSSILARYIQSMESTIGRVDMDECPRFVYTPMVRLW